MAALEKIMQMKQQGLTEPQMIDSLKQEGISPREINEALSQSKIKSELDPQAPIIPISPTQEMPIDQLGQQMPSQRPTPEMPTPPQQQMPPTQEMPISPPQQMPPQQQIPETQMQPSIMGAEMPMEQMPAEIPPATAMPTGQEMPYYEEYQPQQATDIETINDIAEQIVEEKIDPIKKQITDFTRFKNELGLETETINQRLSRIENTFNELQMAILRKIGGYGEDIKNIAREMHETQDSFSKIVNPLTDNIRELKKLTGSSKTEKTRPRPKTKKGKKKGSKADLDFEEYLR